MNVAELNEVLSATMTSRWKGKKFANIQDVHEDIRITCQPVVERYGLEMGLFAVRSDILNRIIEYKLDFKQDLRSNTPKGTMNSIKFVSLIELEKDASINELIIRTEKKIINQNLAHINDSILKARAEIERMEQDKKSLELMLKECEGKLFMEGKAI